MHPLNGRLKRLETSASPTPVHRGTIVIPRREAESEKAALHRWGINPTEWSKIEFGQRPPGQKGDCAPVFIPYGPEATPRGRLVANLNEAYERAYGRRDGTAIDLE